MNNNRKHSSDYRLENFSVKHSKINVEKKDLLLQTVDHNCTPTRNEVLKQEIISTENLIKIHMQTINLLDLKNSDYFVGREREIQILQNKISNLLDTQTGGFIHISGLSGVGKSCAANYVAKCFTSSEKYAKTLDPSPISIHCSTCNNRIFHILTEMLNSSKPKSSQSPKKGSANDLIRFRDTICSLDKFKICITDELDYLSSCGKTRSDLGGRKSHRQNDLIRSLVDLTTLTQSKLIVIAISNSVEIVKDIKAARSNDIVFPPYNEKQLSDIISHKLNALGDMRNRVFLDHSPELIYRRVANHSGDIRTCLSTLRKAASLSIPKLYSNLRKLQLELNATSKSLKSKSSQIQILPKSPNVFEQQQHEKQFSTIDENSQPNSLNKQFLSECTDINFRPTRFSFSQETAASESDLLKADSFISPRSGGYLSSYENSENLSQLDLFENKSIVAFEITSQLDCSYAYSEHSSQLNENYKENLNPSQTHRLNASKVDKIEIPTKSSNLTLSDTLTVTGQSISSKTSNDLRSNRKFGDNIKVDIVHIQNQISNCLEPSESNEESEFSLINCSSNVAYTEFSPVGIATLNTMINSISPQNKTVLLEEISNFSVLKRIYLLALFKAAMPDPNSSVDIIESFSSVSNIEISLEDIYDCYRNLTIVKNCSIPKISMDGSSFQHALDEFVDSGICRIRQAPSRSRSNRRSNHHFLRQHERKFELIWKPREIFSAISILNRSLEDLDLQEHFSTGLET